MGYLGVGGWGGCGNAAIEARRNNWCKSSYFSGADVQLVRKRTNGASRNNLCKK